VYVSVYIGVCISVYRWMYQCIYVDVSVYIGGCISVYRWMYQCI